MKTVVIIGDGMSDYPVAALGGKTPLMAAQKPNMDLIAAKGRTGLFTTIPKGQPKGSAVANLSVLGYDPAQTFQGRAVLEAASMGVNLTPEDVALRCNLISLNTGGMGRETVDTIKNHSAGHIETAQAERLIAQLEEHLGSRGDTPVRFHRGISYRHLLVLQGGWASPSVNCAPPHDHVGELVEKLLPAPVDPKDPVAAKTAARLVELYRESRKLLSEHPVNLQRKRDGLCTADAIWTWSPGKRPVMKTMRERFGITGAVISAVDLVKGMGCYAGLEVIEVEGATGLSDTNYEGKAEAALDALEKHDFVYLHVEATDEAGHSKDLDLKIKCIEYLDRRLIGPLLDGIEKRSIQAAVALLPDHPTPVETGSHADDPVPVAIMSPGRTPDDVDGYDEEKVKKGSLGLLSGDGFIRLALGFEK